MLALFAIIVFTIGAIYRFLIWKPPIPMQSETFIQGLKFVEIGPISPEQYEVYAEDRVVGYVRYRFGYLSAEYPDVGVESVFERELKYETGQMTDQERGTWLPVIARKIRRQLFRDLGTKSLSVGGAMIDGLKFEPFLGPGTERYFIYQGDAILGFVEHRKGVLRADYPDEGVETVFEQVISERDRRLTKAERATWFPEIAVTLQARAQEDRQRPDVSVTLIKQRIRNRMIEYFDLTYETVSEFGTFEIINMWEDLVRNGWDPDFFSQPVFSPAEQSFIKSFLALWDETSDATEEDIFDEQKLRGHPHWVDYIAQSQAGLNLFLERGKFSDDEEQF